MVALLRSLRAAKAIARPVVAAPARAFSVSALRMSAPKPPQLLRQQATGIERFELLGKAEGVDVFDMSPLESTRVGTVQDPIEVFSYYPERHVGCTGFPADSHDTIWLNLNTELKNHRCPECGSVYTLKFEPNEDAASHAHH